MNWIKDRKNLPIVAGLLSATLVGATALVFSEMRNTEGVSSPVTAPIVVTSVVTPAPVKVKAVAKTAKPVVNVLKTHDPFYYRVASVPVQQPHLSIPITLPPIYRQELPSTPKKQPIITSSISGVQDTTPRRVSGTLFSNNDVYAILETNGASQTVQPGDTVDGGRVVSIQPNGLTLKTQDNHTLNVPLSAIQTGVATTLEAMPSL